MPCPLRASERRVLLTAGVLYEAGALHEDRSQRVRLSAEEFAERVCRLSKEERRRLIERGEEILGWSADR